MVGAIIMVVVLVVIIPVAVLMSGAIAAAVLGGLVNHRADTEHEGTELYALAYPGADDSD